MSLRFLSEKEEIIVRERESKDLQFNLNVTVAELLGERIVLAKCLAQGRR